MTSLSSADENMQGVQVIGTASVDVIPNVTNIQFSIESTKKSTSEAMICVAELSSAIINDLKSIKVSDDEFLIKDDHISSTRFTVAPNYQWIDESGTRSRSKQVLVGNQVSSSYKVLIQTSDRELISQIVDLIGKRDPGNSDEAKSSELMTSVKIHNLSFTCDPKRAYELELKARRLAVEDAVVKGQQLVEASNTRFEEPTCTAAGVRKYNLKLGPVIEISTEGSRSRTEDEDLEEGIGVGKRTFSCAARSGGPSVPISPGKSQISAKVEVRFKIIQVPEQSVVQP
jgi:uncharacterized protein YggE